MIDMFYHIFDIYEISALSFDLLRASLKIQKKAALRLRCCELKNVFDRKKRCFARTRKRAKVNLLELAIKIGVIHKK